MDVQQLIKEQVTGNPVALYMKGTPRAPMCGFSATAVQILPVFLQNEGLALMVSAAGEAPA